MENLTRPYALRRAHAEDEAFLLTQRTCCQACGESATCARLEPLAVDEIWLCRPCWRFALGFLYGKREAAQEFDALVDRYREALR